MYITASAFGEGGTVRIFHLDHPYNMNNYDNGFVVSPATKSRKRDIGITLTATAAATAALTLRQSFLLRSISQ